MGAPMARRLAAAGALLVLWNRTIETAERLAADLPNAEPVPSPRHAADRSDIVIVMVTDADAVETVVFDPMDDSYGVAHGIGDGGLVIDMSTTDVARTQEFADRLRARGAEWIDAPVSVRFRSWSAAVTVVLPAPSRCFGPWVHGSPMLVRLGQDRSPRPPTK